VARKLIPSQSWSLNNGKIFEAVASDAADQALYATAAGPKATE